MSVEATPVSPRLVAQRRSTELTLIVMAAAIIGIAYTLASLGANSQIPARIGPFLGLLLLLIGVAHITVRKFAGGADSTLLPLAVLLHGLGYVMITRLDDRLAGLQSMWSLVAIAAFVATLMFVQRAGDLARYKWTLFFAGVGLLLLPMLPGIGVNVNGARIWVRLGPLNFQPGEFAKLALAVFFAAYLAERRELIAASTWKVGPLRLPELHYIAPVLIGWAFAVMVMVGERDLGSSLLFFTLFVVMMWVATERVSYLVIGFVLFGLAAFASARLFGHVQTRVDIWLDPWADEYGKGFQIVQALYGLGDGGIVGTGLGRGSPDKVPEAQNDFIFAAIGEEMGLIGASSVLMAYLLLIGAGLAGRAADRPPVREAAGGRPDHDRRDPGVHHHRRRDQGRPADRYHAPVRELRRLVAAVELHPAGVAVAAQRRRRPPTRRTARRPDRRVNVWPPGSSVAAGDRPV